MRETVAALLLLFSNHGACAFECAAARAPVEKEICAHAELKTADDVLVQTYVAILKRSDSPNRDVLIESERRWLKSRAECMTHTRTPPALCIERMTSVRTDELRRAFGPPDHPVAPVRADPAEGSPSIGAGDCPPLFDGKQHLAFAAAICSDPGLLAGLRAIRADFDRAIARRPLIERQAFANVAGRLLGVPGSCIENGNKIAHACALAAVEANTATLDSYDNSGPEGAGHRHFVHRERAIGDGAKTHISYAQFEKPRDAAERLFNKSILDAVWRDELLTPFDAETKERTDAGSNSEQFSDVSSINTAGGLLTFAVDQWDCCGAHGIGGTRYTTIVKATVNSSIPPRRSTCRILPRPAGRVSTGTRTSAPSRIWIKTRILPC